MATIHNIKINRKKVTVCHISFNHSPYDDRIYWKELLSLKDAGYNVIHIAVAEADSDYISKEGIRIITVKRRTKFSNKWLNKFIQFISKKHTTIEHIYKIACSIDAQVYHYHDLQINALSKKLKNLPQNPKVIYDAHEAFHLLMLEDRPSNLVKKALYNLYVYLVTKWELSKASNCDFIIGTDEYTYQYFKKTLPSIEGSIIFNYSYFKVNKTPLQNKKYDLIYSGLMSPNRGIETTIRSVAKLKQYHSTVKLLLIGPFDNADFEKHINNLIQELNLVPNIHIHNKVPFTEISEFYAQSLIGLGLFQSTPKYSTFIPIKLFEYMAFGMPVIFSNHGPSSEIIKETNCGLLVDYSDIDMISTTIFQLLTNKKLYDELSINGMEAIVNKYNWENEKVKLLSIYDRLLS